VEDLWCLGLAWDVQTGQLLAGQSSLLQYSPFLISGMAMLCGVSAILVWHVLLLVVVVVVLLLLLLLHRLKRCGGGRGS